MTKSFAEAGRSKDSEDNVAESNEDKDSEYSSSSDEEEVIPPHPTTRRVDPQPSRPLKIVEKSVAATPLKNVQEK
jgi:hypothetical protein